MKLQLLLEVLLSFPFAASTQSAHPRTTHKTVTHHAAAKVKTKTKRTTGPTVYYCASGNTVKYHASPGCRGLARCGAAVVPMSLAAAQQRMDPCKWCY